MIDMITDVTALSSKGQVVLPKVIRDSLELLPGSHLMVFSDGENILLKPIKQPDISEFNMLMDEANAWAKNMGMTGWEHLFTGMRQNINRKNESEALQIMSVVTAKRVKLMELL